MIVSGRKAKEVAKEMVMGKCPSCSAQNTVDMHIIQTYAHIFWIPTFPMNRKGISECNNCHQVLEYKQMPAELKSQYKELKSRGRTPVWMFSGLLLIAVLIVLIVIQDGRRNERNALLISDPKRGDVFQYKTPEKQYTLLKVATVTKDSVFVNPSEFESNKLSGLREIKAKGDAAYSGDVLGMSRTELKEMLDDGRIRNIERE